MANQRPQVKDGRPRGDAGRRLLARPILPYVPLLAVVAITVTMLGTVMYGANRLALRQQLVGAWRSAAPGVEVEFFEDGTYRWIAQEATTEVIHRGHYIVVGTDRVSLRDDEAVGAAPFTTSGATYVVQAVADQLTLRNASESLVFLGAED